MHHTIRSDALGLIYPPVFSVRCALSYRIVLYSLAELHMTSTSQLSAQSAWCAATIDKRQVIDSRLEASMIIDAAGMQKGVVLGEWA